MRAQHRLQRKRRTAGTALGIVRREERYQRGPGNDALQLLDERALAGFLQTELEVQGGLFHGPYFLRLNLQHLHKRVSYAEFP